MSTRSTIAVRNLNGSVSSVYCHSDGYPSHNGKILQENYKTLEQVNALLELGSLSILGEVLGKKVDFNRAFEHRGQCIAYGRDRGETEITTKSQLSMDFADCQNHYSQEYTYLFDEFTNMWFIAEDNSVKLQSLENVLRYVINR
jgi:hypothetical protein